MLDERQYRRVDLVKCLLMGLESQRAFQDGQSDYFGID